jgi:hypothetical protein
MSPQAGVVPKPAGVSVLSKSWCQSASPGLIQSQSLLLPLQWSVCASQVVISLLISPRVSLCSAVHFSGPHLPERGCRGHPWLRVFQQPLLHWAMGLVGSRRADVLMSGQCAFSCNWKSATWYSAWKDFGFGSVSKHDSATKIVAALRGVTSVWRQPPRVVTGLVDWLT